jgi:hypothetical protein
LEIVGEMLGWVMGWHDVPAGHRAGVEARSAGQPSAWRVRAGPYTRLARGPSSPIPGSGAACCGSPDCEGVGYTRLQRRRSQLRRPCGGGPPAPPAPSLCGALRMEADEKQGERAGGYIHDLKGAAVQGASRPNACSAPLQGTARRPPATTPALSPKPSPPPSDTAWPSRKTWT